MNKRHTLDEMKLASKTSVEKDMLSPVEVRTENDEILVFSREISIDISASKSLVPSNDTMNELWFS
jgi:hypothetical protein